MARNLFLFAGSLASLVAVSSLQAGNLAPACLAGTLAQYESLTPVGSYNVPFECSVGILNYTDFTSSLNLDPSLVQVTPVAGVNGLGGGFELTPLSSVAGTASDPFRVAAGNSATYYIDWFFVIDAGPVADGASLGMDPPFGDVTITQNYCTDSFFAYTDAGALECTTPPTAGPNTNHISAPQTLQVSTLPPPGVLSASLTFNPPAFAFASVDTVIQLNGDAGPLGSGFDGTTSAPDVIPPPAIPEPGTFVLLGGALLLVYFLRRSKAFRGRKV
ncbi:MAG TPA: PEP-CTERM sorting domain-containing protein [Bryobacteraceae bacterium]|nr:PEP-CTERM sorting domain-containing protein [Bryobacteraceae bacterium]